MKKLQIVNRSSAELSLPVFKTAEKQIVAIVDEIIKISKQATVLKRERAFAVGRILAEVRFSLAIEEGGSWKAWLDKNCGGALPRQTACLYYTMFLVVSGLYTELGLDALGEEKKGLTNVLPNVSLSAIPKPILLRITTATAPKILPSIRWFLSPQKLLADLEKHGMDLSDDVTREELWQFANLEAKEPEERKTRRKKRAAEIPEPIISKHRKWRLELESVSNNAQENFVKFHPSEQKGILELIEKLHRSLSGAIVINLRRKS